MPEIEMQGEVDDPDIENLSFELRETYKFLNKTLTVWDKQWSNDYLLSLRERRYGAESASKVRNPKVGEIYILKTDQPKSQWPLAKVIEVLADSEGVVRAVRVVVRGQEMLRTIDRLVPLEVSEPDTWVGQAEHPPEEQTGTRSIRSTALRSQER